MKMETNNAKAPIITVVHSDNSKLDKTDVIVEGKDPKQKQTAYSELNASLKVKDNTDKEKEDDQDSVIIEEVENKTIEVDEDSGEELEVTVDQSAESNNGANNSFSLQKITEFVIVNAANVLAAEATGGTESTNRYPIEDLQIKDELAENITADINSNDVLENDPMDLLELNNRSECSSSTRSQEDTEDYGDDVSSVGSSSVKTASSSSTSVLEWVKDYPWLLYEEIGEQFGYCLYCDTKVNIKSQRSVKQHGMSLYHKERCENYLAFRDEEDKNGLSMELVEIKEEFGTDSRVEALKLKRKSQSGALNNFNWRRWMADYPWLQRDSTEGTVGFCKYCLIHFNVEFSYLRDRHQEGGKHKEAEKHYVESNKSKEQAKTSNADEINRKESAIDKNHSKTQRWLENVENEPAMVRCKICGSKMFKNNFLRHLRTNLHEQNEKMYLKIQKYAKQKGLNEECAKNQQNWKLYVRHHPWLMPDPSDPTFAYCKYCEKRIIYGASAAKRSLHENSSQHKLNESEFQKQSRKVNTNYNESAEDKESAQKDVEENVERSEEEGEEVEDQNEEDDEDNEEEAVEEEEEENNDDDNEESDDEEQEEEEQEEEDDEANENSQQGKETEDENESKKRVYRLTEEWINQYTWCKRYNKDPRNFIYCIYCKIPLSVTYSRSKHQKTSFHISAEKEFLSRQDKKQKIQEKKHDNETSPFYEWAIPLKNNTSSYSCRYCRVRISKNYSKKQHAASKIHQINESIYKNNRRKSLRRDENSNSSQQTSKIVTQITSKKGQTFAKVVIKAPSTVTLIKQWQKKFPWLSYKRSELRSNYGHCKMCDSSLYIRSLKHVFRHLRSARHINVAKAKKSQKVEKDEEEERENDLSPKIIKKGPKEEMQTSPPPNDVISPNQTQTPTTTTTQSTSAATKSPKAFNYKSTIAEMKKRFSWIEEKSERPNYALCRYCNTNIPLKILLLRNHSNSHKHRHSVVNYHSFNGEKTNRPVSADLDEDNGDGCKSSTHGNDDDDVIIVEENNEEILISEQDENWAVKSEGMDEHEELDYLLQSSFNNSQNKSHMRRNVRKKTHAVDDDPPTKRIKPSQSFRSFNDSNTSLVASLLTTPLTLASCLGPLIQQQIQQANISQTSLTKTNTSRPAPPEAEKTSSVLAAETENTYDLFFKSISETMKKLPVDLAAEGKLRVMQIICDLELQALKRQQSTLSELASSSNTSGGGISYQPTSTSTGMQPGCSSCAKNDLSTENNAAGNETIITQFNTNAEVSPPLGPQLLPSTSTNSSGVEKQATCSATSPIIGVMDKNGLQTIHLKTSAAKQIPRSTANTTVTNVANSGIRCIPFRNLSQTATPAEATSAKITRIQVPLNVTTQPPNPNVNTVNTSKNLLNFRNIQITKRIATPPSSASPATSINGPPHQQTASQTSTMVNQSPQRTYITSIQPQLQRWGCSVNGATTTHHTPTSAAVNHLQQLSAQQTSTPISKKH